jgi:hypothetical protein
MALGPERASGWIGTLLPLAREGGPILSLFLFIIGSATVWYLLGALDRAVVRNHVLVERLLTQQAEHRAEILRYVHCTPQP